MGAASAVPLRETATLPLALAPAWCLTVGGLIFSAPRRRVHVDVAVGMVGPLGPFGPDGQDQQGLSGGKTRPLSCAKTGKDQ